MNFQDRRNYNRRLRDLERNVKFPGMRASGGGDRTLYPGYTVSHIFYPLTSLSQTWGGLYLSSQWNFNVAGSFATAVLQRTFSASAYTFFSYEDGYSTAITSDSIDFEEVIMSLKTHVTAEVTMGLTYAPPPLLYRETYISPVVVIGYPILSAFPIPYEGGSGWVNPFNGAYPDDQFRRNLLLSGSGNGHCNGPGGVCDNYIIAFQPGYGKSELNWYYNFTTGRAQSIINHIFWEQTGASYMSVVNEISGRIPPLSYSGDNYGNGRALNSGRLYLPGGTDVFGIAWYVFDLADWWYNIVNNGWLNTSGSLGLDVYAFISGDAYGGGVPYNTNITLVHNRTTVEDASGINEVFDGTTYPLPVYTPGFGDAHAMQSVQVDKSQSEIPKYLKLEQ